MRQVFGDDSADVYQSALLRGIRGQYHSASSLEPIMKVEVSVPEEFQGSVIGQLNQRRGVIQNSETAEGYMTVVAEIPLNMMFGYSTDLRSATQGKGEFTMEFAKYQQVLRNDQEALIAEYQKKKAAEGK